MIIITEVSSGECTQAMSFGWVGTDTCLQKYDVGCGMIVSEYFLHLFLIVFSTQATELTELEAVLHQQNMITEMPQDPIAFRRPVNEVLNALNRDWGRGNREYLAKEFVLLWQRKHALNGMDRHALLETDRVRIQLAGLLGMTTRLCLESVPNDELRSFVLSHVQNRSISERALAIRMLAYVGLAVDVPLLADIVRTEAQGLSTFAVIALDHLHEEDGITALFELEQRVKAPELKSLISERLMVYRQGGAIPSKKCD